MEFPIGLLGVALGTILLPSLSKHHATRSTDEYSRLLDWGLRHDAAARGARLPRRWRCSRCRSSRRCFSTAHSPRRTRSRRATRSSRYSVGLVGLDPGQGARARLLRAAEHQDAGEDRDREPRRDAGHESCCSIVAAAACRARACDQPRRLRQCRRCSTCCCAAHGDLPPAAGLGPVSCSSSRSRSMRWAPCCG